MKNRISYAIINSLIILGCIKFPANSSSSPSPSDIQSSTHTRSAMHPCLKIKHFLCAKVAANSPSDCSEGIGLAKSLLRAMEANETMKAEIISDNCQKNIAKFDQLATQNGFQNYETMLKSTIKNPEDLKAFENLMSQN